MHPRSRTRALLVALGLLVCAEVAVAGVYLTKYRRDKQTNEDVFELTNSAFAIVDVGDWIIRASLGEYVIPDFTLIPPRGRITVRTPVIVHQIGETIELIDDTVLRGGGLVDRVRFGTEGGAPAPPVETGGAIVRIPDGLDDPPPSPIDDETFWTVDLTPNFGFPDNAPAPLLGTSLRINEIRIGAIALPDSVELYNPSGSFVDLTGWFVTSANDAVLLSGSVGPFGLLALELPTTELYRTQRIDLFAADSSRVDQKSSAPVALTDCYGDCPDGSSPSTGFDFVTCGGWFTWFPVGCTLGLPNSILPGQGCSTTGVHSPADAQTPGVLELRWGALKQIYR